MAILPSSIPTGSRGVLFHNELSTWKSIEGGGKSERIWDEGCLGVAGIFRKVKKKERKHQMKQFLGEQLLGAGEAPRSAPKTASKSTSKKKVRQNKAKHKNRKFECKEETFFS
jgi:hypothetical protein